MGWSQRPSWNRTLVTLWEQGLKLLLCDSILRGYAHAIGRRTLVPPGSNEIVQQALTTSDVLLAPLGMCLEEASEGQ